MALLRSIEGRFYEIDDQDLARYGLELDQASKVLAEQLLEGSGPPEGFDEGGEVPQVVIELFGGGMRVIDGPLPAIAESYSAETMDRDATERSD